MNLPHPDGKEGPREGPIWESSLHPSTEPPDCPGDRCRARGGRSQARDKAGYYQPGSCPLSPAPPDHPLPSACTSLALPGPCSRRGWTADGSEGKQAPRPPGSPHWPTGPCPSFVRAIFGDELTFATCGLGLSWAKEQMQQPLVSKWLGAHRRGTRTRSCRLFRAHLQPLSELPTEHADLGVTGLALFPSNKKVTSETEQEV